MKKNNGKLSYEDTTFIGLLKIVKLRALKNWSFFWSIVLTGCIILYSEYYGDITIDMAIMSDKLTTTLLGASAGILAIVIAGLAITIALFKPSFLPRMLEIKFLHRLLFLFWFSSVLWGVSIVLCLLLVVICTLKQTYLIPIFFSIELFTFFFATFHTISLTGSIIRFTLQNAQIK
jgi:hypothetical protein